MYFLLLWKRRENKPQRSGAAEYRGSSACGGRLAGSAAAKWRKRGGGGKEGKGRGRKGRQGGREEGKKEKEGGENVEKWCSKCKAAREDAE